MLILLSVHRKSFCTASNGNETLAESATKNGGVPKFPGKLESLDDPSERVKNLVDQIMNITFYESAQLSTLSSARCRFAPFVSTLCHMDPFI